MPPAAGFLGFRLMRSGNGSAVYEFRPNENHQNTSGSLHGGVLCALADETMGRAFKTLLPSGSSGVTVEFKINFLSPVFPGDCLRASSEVISRGKSFFYIECAIRHHSGKLAAKSSGTFRVVSGGLRGEKGKEKSKSGMVRRSAKGDFHEKAE